jgi:hypothetical protein
VSATAQLPSPRFRIAALLAACIGFGVALAGCSTTTVGDPEQRTTSEPLRAAPSGRTSPTTAPAVQGAAFLDPHAVRAALADTRGDIVAANTYDYRHLAGYRRTALATTTGVFTQTLAHTIDSVIADNAPRLHARQHAEVNRIGIADMHGQDATVLIFGQLTVRNTTYPSGRTDPFEAVAGVRLVQERWLLTRIVTDGSATCDPPGTAALSTACATAGSGAAAITTFRRSTFERDFARAVSMLTGPLLADVRSTKSATLRTMLSGGFDLRAVVVASAVESATPDQVEILIALNGYRSTSSTAVPQHLAVTVENVGRHWLLSDVKNVGVS